MKGFLTLLSVLLFAPVQAEETDWSKNKKYLGKNNGFKVYVVREAESKVAFNYFLEIVGKNRGCEPRDSDYYLDMRWGGYKFGCTETKYGLRIEPLTRSGKNVMRSVIEHSRNGDYFTISGLTEKDIRATM